MRLDENVSTDISAPASAAQPSAPWTVNERGLDIGGETIMLSHEKAEKIKAAHKAAIEKAHQEGFRKGASKLLMDSQKEIEALKLRAAQARVAPDIITGEPTEFVQEKADRVASAIANALAVGGHLNIKAKPDDVLRDIDAAMRKET